MEITNYSTNALPNLHHVNGRTDGTVWKTGTMPGPKEPHDLLEISPTARQMAADAIQHQPAYYFGTIEIHDSLQNVLNGKPPEVRNAVYTLIQTNLLPDGSVSDEETRSALLEAGLSQAKFLADRYMTSEESAQFLDTIHQIAAIAKTRTVDPQTGEASYVTPPQKPRGAPADYVQTSELMKRFEPQTYERFRDALTSGGDWGKILVQFAMKVPQNKEWLTKYQEENDKIVNDLRNTRIENRSPAKRPDSAT